MRPDGIVYRPAGHRNRQVFPATKKNIIMLKGYVYILEVKDIDLPVCKIGMTSRHPGVRCSEINNSSTGDFIWEVAYYFAVDNCKKLESLVHKKLKPLKQKRREFFNITAENGNKAVISILNNQSEIKIIELEKPGVSKIIKLKKNKVRSATKTRDIDQKYAELLLEFSRMLGVKGRPFGQLNKPSFGVSDGNDGIQWNLAIQPLKEKIKLGVNLEGLKYQNWPVTDLILSELEEPTLDTLVSSVSHSDLVTLCFTRDAWQVNSRPDIQEKYLGGSEILLSDITKKKWFSILTEALGCLDPQKKYRGRNKQLVTMKYTPRNGERVKELQVSPHLTIWTSVTIAEDITEVLQERISRLTPVYEWVDNLIKRT